MTRRPLAATLVAVAVFAIAGCATGPTATWSAPSSNRSASPSGTPTPTPSPTASAAASASPSAATSTQGNPPGTTPPAQPPPPPPPPSTSSSAPSSNANEEACAASLIAILSTLGVINQLIVLDDPDATDEEKAAARQQAVDLFNGAGNALIEARDRATDAAVKAAHGAVANATYALAGIAQTGTTDDILNGMDDGSAWLAAVEQRDTACAPYIQ